MTTLVSADDHLVLARLDADRRELLRDDVQLVRIHREDDGVLDFGGRSWGARSTHFLHVDRLK